MVLLRMLLKVIARSSDLYTVLAALSAITHTMIFTFLCHKEHFQLHLPFERSIPALPPCGILLTLSYDAKATVIVWEDLMSMTTLRWLSFCRFAFTTCGSFILLWIGYAAPCWTQFWWNRSPVHAASNQAYLGGYEVPSGMPWTTVDCLFTYYVPQCRRWV